MLKGKAALTLEMATKIPVDRLAETISKILADYGDEIQENINEATKRVTKAGVRAVKANSRSSFDGTGKYASGWTSKIEVGRLTTTGIVYNGKVPGLAHLLENDHALRNGGRYRGRPHIEPVEKEMVEDFGKAVEKAI